MTEVIRKRGPRKNLDDVEYATLEWVDCFYREEVSAEEVGLKTIESSMNPGRFTPRHVPIMDVRSSRAVIV